MFANIYRHSLSICTIVTLRRITTKKHQLKLHWKIFFTFSKVTHTKWNGSVDHQFEQNLITIFIIPYLMFLFWLALNSKMLICTMHIVRSNWCCTNMALHKRNKKGNWVSNRCMIFHDASVSFMHYCVSIHFSLHLNVSYTRLREHVQSNLLIICEEKTNKSIWSSWRRRFLFFYFFP